MEQVFLYLLESDERPLTHDDQLDEIKILLSVAKLSANPLIHLSYAQCRKNVCASELTSNFAKFKGVSSVSESEEYGLTVAFDGLLNAVNFVKFFTIANEVECNPYIFDMTFAKDVERNDVLCERKDKLNMAKKQKKKPVNGSVKYTARFYFYIESTHDFELSKKIIGKKGKNMKIILNNCENVFENGKAPRDFLKLRLRGRGSSYKEGAGNKESDEDLHLCLSAKNAQVLARAIESIEVLLEGIFKEYNVFCKKQGLKTVKRLYRLISDLQK